MAIDCARREEDVADQRPADDRGKRQDACLLAKEAPDQGQQVLVRKRGSVERFQRAGIVAPRRPHAQRVGHRRSGFASELLTLQLPATSCGRHARLLACRHANGK
jgi:hypothetical protein